MLCFDCQAHLSDFLDNELSDRLRADVENHLRGCTGCDTLRIDLARIIEASANLPLHTPSPRVWERIEREISSPAVVAGPASWWDRLGARRLDFSVSAKHVAAAAALVVVGFATLATINATSPGALPTVQVDWNDLSAVNQQGTLAPLASVETPVDTAKNEVAEMERSVLAKRGDWSPELRAAFDKSLAELDARIATLERAYEREHTVEQSTPLLNALGEKLKMLERFASAGTTNG
jgi:hypothetical protein